MSQTDLDLTVRGRPFKDRPSGTSDPLAVHTSALAPVLIAWQEAWERERPWGGQTTGGQPVFLGPHEYLSEQSGISKRRLYDIINRRHAFVTFRIAEKLLMAIDRDYMLSNGQIPVVPNPGMSLERWHAIMQERGCV